MLFSCLSLGTWLDFGRKLVGMRGHLSWDMMDLKRFEPHDSVLSKGPDQLGLLGLQQKNGTLLWQ